MNAKCITALSLATIMSICIAPGCLTSKAPDLDKSSVPEPINQMLPASIAIHPFTEARTFDNAGGVKGIEMRIKALDIDGDSTKAFGDFRLEMYTLSNTAADNAGKKVATWDVSLFKAKTNGKHWHEISRTYKFLLEWDKPIPVGQKYVLQALFTSPFTNRLITTRVFISGE